MYLITTVPRGFLSYGLGGGSLSAALPESVRLFILRNLPELTEAYLVEAATDGTALPRGVYPFVVGSWIASNTVEGTGDGWWETVRYQLSVLSPDDSEAAAIGQKLRALFKSRRKKLPPWQGGYEMARTLGTWRIRKATLPAQNVSPVWMYTFDAFIVAGWGGWE